MKTLKLLSILFLLAGSFAAQTIKATRSTEDSDKRVPTIAEWLSLSYPSNPTISPDGLYVAYETTKGNWEADAFETRTWVVAVTTGARYQAADFKGSVYGSRWSPDGKELAFLSRRDGHPQIYLIKASGGDAVQLTGHENGVGSFGWSPDGRRIAFTSSDRESEDRRLRREKSGDFQIIGEPPAPTHLWMIELSGEHSKVATPTRLTSGNAFTVGNYSWSPDSTEIVFDATNPSEIYSAFRGQDIGSMFRSDIYTLKLRDNSVRKIVANKGPDFNPIYSPDGKEIAYQTSNAALGQEFNFEAIYYLASVSSLGGMPRILTKDFDETPGLIDWSPEGIYFSALQKTSSHLFRLDPKTRSVVRVSRPGQAIYSQFSFTGDFRQAAFISEDGARLPEVYISSLSSFEPRPVTESNEQLKPFRHSTREVVQWKSKDGTAIEGVLVKPADFDRSKKYPLLVVVHTGPANLDQPSLNPFNDIYPIEPLVTRGTLVLLPNFRGSIGYGNRFRLLLTRNLGLPQYLDVISGVDHLIAQGLVDANRIGAMGYSHGGYVASFIATYSDRFKAVSVGGAVSDWRIFYTNSDAGPGMLNLLQATPWDDPEYYRQIAPLSYARRAKTPTLIQHGSLDVRAPIAGDYELYRALKDQGVFVKMIVYRGAGHAGGSWKLKQFHALKQHNYEWFGHWIWGDKLTW